MSSPRPRSLRSRFWRKRRTFKFIVGDEGVVTEETTDSVIPAWFATNSFGITTGRDESPVALTLTGAGAPANDATYEYYRRRMVAWLFIQECRLSPAPSVAPSRDNTDPRAWNRYLSSEGLSATDAGLGRSRLRRGGARSCATVPFHRWIVASDAVWRRALVARLALLFDRETSDALLHALADTLTGPRWYDWLHEPVFEPMRQTLNAHWQRVPYMAGLHSVIQRRARVQEDLAANRAPILIAIRGGRHRVTFGVPKRHPSESQATHDRAVSILIALKAIEYGYSYGRSTDLAPLAAATWIARRYIKAPVSVAGLSSQNALATHFGVPLRRLRVWVARLKADPLRWLARGSEIFSPGRKPQRPVRVTPSMALNSPVTKSPEGLAAIGMLDEANRLQYGPIANGDGHAPVRNARANALRKKAFARLIRLYEAQASNNP